MKNLILFVVSVGIIAVVLLGNNLIINYLDCPPPLPIKSSMLMTSGTSNLACAAWQDLALGSGTGSAAYSECGPDTVAISTNAVTGPGATSDNQHIIYHELCGNGEIIAKVAGITNSGYAGLFVRESSAAGARKGAIMTQKGSQVFRQIRLTTDGITAQASYMASGHQWLKLTRSGTQVMGSWSTNGSTWNMAFLTSLSMTDCVVMGMFAYSGNSNTTITATFTDISIVQSDSIPATEVAFADSSLTAQSGDTVEICVELENPCYCSPLSVDVALASDSLPHLVGFEPQTLTFEPGDTVQCFSLVLGAADTSGTYTFELTNISGGYESEVGELGVLTLDVEEGEAGETAENCGEMIKLSGPATEEESQPWFDRFGNRYAYSELISPASSGPPCDCSEFEGQIANLADSYFYLEFMDCASDTDLGFADDEVDPLNTLPKGYYYRKTACEVFADLSEIILRANPPCPGENAPLVNIRLYRKGEGFGLPNMVVAAATAIYPPYHEQHGGIIDGYPWRILNSGHLSDNEIDITHGQLVVDFDQYTFHAGQGDGLLNSQEHDLYSVLLHEALHILGFSALMNPTDGSPRAGADAGYGRFATFLQLDNNDPVVGMSGGDPYHWELQIDQQDLHKSCMDPVASGPDMVFAVSGTEQYPVYTGTPGNGSAFSHLNTGCDGNATPAFLMNYFLPTGESRVLTDAEKSILCALGYQVAGQSNCDCIVAGADDLGEGCEQTPAYIMEMCQGVTLRILPADLLDNDIADEVTSFEPLGPNDGNLVYDENTGEWVFTPAHLGLHVLKYIPMSNACTQAGNVTLVYVRAMPCTEECEFTNPVYNPVDGGHNGNTCNLICNPEFYSNNQSINFVQSIYCEVNSPGFELPGWIPAVGTPDYYKPPSVYTGSGAIRGLFGPPGSVTAGEEPFFTPVEVLQGNYFMSYYRKIIKRTHPTSGDGYFSLRTSIVTQDAIDEFGLCNLSVNSLSDLDLPPGSITEVFQENMAVEADDITHHRIFSCFENSEEDLYIGLLIHGNAALSEEDPSYTGVELFVDQVELIPDNFSAGADISIQCGQEIELGGIDYCMVSDLIVRYIWKDELDNELLIYTVRQGSDGSTMIKNQNGATLQEIPTLEVSPVITTTYYLERTPVDDNTIHYPDDIVFCETIDEVLVTVQYPNAENPYFTYSGCGFVVNFNPATTSGTHFWDFGDGFTSTASSPIHSYSEPGTYLVSHEVGEVEECTYGFYQTEIVVPFLPDAGFSVDQGDCAGATAFTFTAEETGGVHIWNFGQGVFIGAAEEQYGFLPGSYTISHTVETACGTSTETTTLEVSDCTTACTTCDENNTLGVANEETTLEDAGLDPGTYTGQTYCVEGTLIVPDEYKFYECEFLMQPGAKILVKNQGKLYLKTSYLHGCDRMWLGIELEPGTIMEAYNFTTIADAQYGIVVLSSADPNINSAELTLKQSFFWKNLVGLLVAPTADGSSQKIEWICTGNTFDGDEALLPPFSGQSAAPYNLPAQNEKALAGIWLNNLSGANILDNTFTRLTAGVGALQSAFILADNQFTDIRTNTSYYPQFGAFPFGANGVAVYALGGPAYEVLRVTENSIKQCRFGVLAGHTTPRLQNNALSQAELGLFAGLLGPHGGTVTDNTLEDITTAGIWINENTPGGNLTITGNAVTKTGTGPGAGILLYHVGGHAASETALVSENPVTVAGGSGIYALSCSQVVVRDNDEIALDNTATCRAGILLEGCQDMLLVDNTVTGAGTGGSQNTGIEIASSPGNIYCCNDVDNTRLGVSVAGGSLSENNFRGTMFGDHATSLYLPNSAAILGSQVHTENRWQGSGGAVYDVLGDYAQLYSFSVDASGLSGNLEFMPASVTPPEWFDDLENSNPQTVCAPENCEVDGLVADSPDSKRIASGDIDAGDYTYTIVWELQRYLYRQLQGWSGQDSVIQAFMATYADSTIGDFQGIDEAIEAMFNADTAEIATLKANLDLVIAELDSLLSLDRMLVNASAPEVPALMAQREVLIDSLFSLAGMNKVLADTIEENRADAAAAAGTLNAGITTTQDFEENEQIVNEVYLSWVEKGWQNLTGTEKAELEAVALQCPLLGGNAVYRARSLLSAAKGTLVSYDDSTACAGNEALIAPPPASTLTLYSEQELSVFPNPANDVVIITWRTPIVLSGTIRLYDSYGRQTRYIALGAGVSIQPVNIRDLYSGIYILRVELDGRTYTNKIAVKH